MMKLKYLFDNPALAKMLLDNWEYDQPSLDLFRYFRISANAIYPFKKSDEFCFLRFCPASEKRKENIIAELDFIGYLRNHRYEAVEPVPSKAGDVLVRKLTPWGEYYASVFKGVKGKQISETSLDGSLLFAYGAALGQLHKLSSEYSTSRTGRWTHVDVFNWIEETLRELSLEASPLDELNLLREYFSILPITSQNYGLIHYDFEPDNVFYDAQTGSCSVIDFDDAMIHWYVMDIVQALDSLKSESAENEFPHYKGAFINGYRSRFALDEDRFAAMPLFKRFAGLYAYTRIARSIQESWENEPEWLVPLRKKLTDFLERNSAPFGKPIEMS
jgi:Ser/Thr protein kinase RdoA (MazF antagonist)